MSTNPQDADRPSLSEVITALGLMGSMSNVESHWRERLCRLALRMQHENADPWAALAELERSLEVAAKNPQKAQMQMEYWLAQACAKLLSQYTQPMVALPPLDLLRLWRQLSLDALTYELSHEGREDSDRSRELRQALQWLDGAVTRGVAVMSRQVLRLGPDGLPVREGAPT